MRTTFDQSEQFDQEIDRGPYRGEDRSMDHRGMGRHNYREQPLDEPVQPTEPHDLTLGMTALAGIFLAVVLVCAVFFGFGYSTGRTLHGSKSPAPQATPAAASSSGLETASAAGDATSASAATPPLAAAQPVAKPSAGAPLSDAGLEATAQNQQADPAAKAQTPEETPGFPPPALRTSAPAAHPTSVSTATDSPSSTLPAAAGGVMVQIAAVMRQTDADMLAHALRTNGYAAIVRTEPQDKFLHVQIGPFPTRDQAKAMRARLLGDGYNAFLKP